MPGTCSSYTSHEKTVTLLAAKQHGVELFRSHITGETQRGVLSTEHCTVLVEHATLLWGTVHWATFGVVHISGIISEVRILRKRNKQFFRVRRFLGLDHLGYREWVFGESNEKQRIEIRHLRRVTGVSVHRLAINTLRVLYESSPWYP